MTNQQSEQGSFCILALFRFLEAKRTDEEVKKLRDDIEDTLRPYHTRGTLLLATEGINGTICFPNQHSDAVQGYLLTLFPKLQTRVSYHPTENVFFRFRVRIKPEIVTMGKIGSESDPTARLGTLVSPGPDWDRLVQDPECLVIDTRNEYEYKVGSFQRAVNPHTDSFVEFPSWLQEQFKQEGWSQEMGDKKPRYKKVAMFCTGGIRCMKSTAYCLDLLEKNNVKGEDKPEVYHLKGGILAYLNDVPEERSTFEGECYVFDHRTAVQHGLKPSETFTLCHACREPLTPEDRQHPTFQLGVSCHACIDNRQGKRSRYAERQKQMGLRPSHLRGDAKEVRLLRQQKRQLEVSKQRG